MQSTRNVVRRKRVAIYVAAVLSVAMMLSISALCLLSNDSKAADTSGSEYDKYFEGGSGTMDDPWIIADKTQFTNIASTDYDKTARYFVLVTDIVITGTWTPIGDNSNFDKVRQFKGVLDGNGHTVDYKCASCTYGGLFAGIAAGGVVKNLSVAAKTTGTSFAGGICGFNYGLVDNCKVSGTVTIYRQSGTELCAGGIVGHLGNAGTISRCTNAAVISVTGLTTMAGGIAGRVGTNGGTISYCVNAGAVSSYGHGSGYEITGPTLNTGGIVGQINGPITVTDCISNGAVVSDTGSYITRTLRSGTIVGDVSVKSGVALVNCYGRYNGVTERTRDGSEYTNSIYDRGSPTLTNTRNTASLETESYSAWATAEWYIDAGQIPELKAPASMTNVSGAIAGHRGVPEVLVDSFNVVYNNGDTGTVQIYQFKSDKGASVCTFNYFDASYDVTLNVYDALDINGKNVAEVPIYLIGSVIRKADFEITVTYPDNKKYVADSEDIESIEPVAGENNARVTLLGKTCTVRAYFHDTSTWGVLAYGADYENPAFYTCTKGQAVTIDEVEKDGYDFKGWYTAESKGTLISEDNPYTFTPSADRVIYAQWSSKSSGGGCMSFIIASFGGAGALIAAPFMIRKL